MRIDQKGRAHHRTAKKPHLVVSVATTRRIQGQLHTATLDLVRDLPGSKTPNIYAATEGRWALGWGVVTTLASALMLGAAEEKVAHFLDDVQRLARELAAEHDGPSRAA